MALGLHADCKQRMIEALASGLSKIRAKNGMFLDRGSVFDGVMEANKALPQRGSVHDLLTEIIDEFPFVEFVGDRISVDLLERDEYVSNQDFLLTELHGYGDIKVVANYLVDLFDSLPWSYTLTIALPKRLNTVFGESKSFEFSDTVRIAAANELLNTTFPLKSEHANRHKRLHKKGLLSGSVEENPQWDAEAAYLQIAVDGYVGLYGGTATARKVDNTLRALFGMGLAQQLLTVEYNYSPYPPKYNYIVHKLTDKNWTVEGRFQLQDSYSAVLIDLSASKLWENIGNGEQQQSYTASVLSNVATVLQSRDKAEQILLGAQWLFDSYIRGDDLLSYIRATVVLEILLGDKDSSDEMGLGALLRNRCAYLIGKTQAGRASILADFTKIYDVRSQIVHRGKSNLNFEERALFRRLRWMCNRAIQEEIKLLKYKKNALAHFIEMFGA